MRRHVKAVESKGSSAFGGRCSLLIACTVFGFTLFSPAATADLVVCGAGSGAGQCDSPTAFAVDRTAGLLFVADSGNRRVDVFDADDGSFLRAFGWDVIPAGQPGDIGAGLEVCTMASTCKAGSSGAGSGQFGASLGGIAVDNDPASPAFGDLYVFDGYYSPSNGTNNRMQRFDPNGEFVLMFGGKVNKTKVEEGAPEAQQNVCTAASGDVCQAGVSGTAPGHFNFGPKPGLGPGGVVYVADDIGGGNRRVQKFSHEGELLETISPLPPGEFGENLMGFAVHSTGAFYLANAGGRPVHKYDPTGTLLETFHPSYNIQTLASDAAGNLFVADNTGEIGNGTAVYQYDPAGTLVRVLYGNGTLKARPVSLAPYQSANGDLFAVESTSGGLGRVLHIAFEPPGPVVNPDPQQTNANPIGNTTATLNTKINPEGKATTYHFEYVDDATYQKDYEESGPEHGFDNAKATPEEKVTPATTPPFAPPLFRLSLAGVPIGCTDPATEAELPESPCLVPNTEYHLRAVATNTAGKDTGPESTFEAKPPFEILATWASEVGIDIAKLGAEVNPLNIQAQGHFEYVEEATYLEDVTKAEEEGKSPEEVAEAGFEHAQSTAEVDFGSGEAPLTRTVQLHSLKANTAYRYRIFLEDFFTGEFGEGRAFTTFPPPLTESDTCLNRAFRIGVSAGLPDCRAYEMVSPVDKEGGEIAVLWTGENISEAEYLQSAAAVPARGRGLTYSSYRSFGDAVSTPWSSQYIASRHSLGDPEEGWSSHGISPPRKGASFGGLVRDIQYKAFAEDLGWGWLRSDTEPPLEPKAIPGFPNLYRRDNASDAYEAICPVKPKDVAPREYFPKPQGASADGSMVVFRADSKLTEDASGAELETGEPIPQLYACAEGELRLVSVLPVAQGGNASDGSSSVGTSSGGLNASHRHDSLHNAVSGDGARIYWTDSGKDPGAPGKIYLRERPFAEGAECGGPPAPCTVAVSEAVGSLGADKKARFWTASPDGSRAIFSFTEGALAGNLYEFDAGSKATSLIAEGVSGLAGFSEDASRLYFVSTKALAPDAVAGEPNLYLHEAGDLDFELVAAMLGGTDTTAYCGVDRTSPFMRCTRATADGGRLVFISRDPLTGYDNKDALSGEPDSEVFLYEASAGGGEGELLCVSCNPSGGRPAGQGVEVYGFAKLVPIAARIPAWEHSLYAPRALSADGRRLFFESFDALVPTDTNGAQDVYEWEEAGKGDCDSGDANYFEANGGCLSLISSGKSPRDSRFADASADGSDVFFKTAASLLPKDPGLIDIYDARVEGGFPIPPEPVPPCEGEACQSPPAPPEASSPASAGFRGQDDPTAAGGGSKPPCPKKGKRGAKKATKKARCPKKQRKGKHERRQRQGRGRR